MRNFVWPSNVLSMSRGFSYDSGYFFQPVRRIAWTGVLDLGDLDAFDTQIFTGERKRRRIGSTAKEYLVVTYKGLCLFHPPPFSPSLPELNLHILVRSASQLRKVSIL